MKQLGQPTADKVQWAVPRLMCIAGDFNRYDEHTVSQINRNIELMQYKRYGQNLLILKLVNVKTMSTSEEEVVLPKQAAAKGPDKTAAELLAQAGLALSDRFGAVREMLLALGKDISTPLSNYVLCLIAITYMPLAKQ